MIATQQLTPTLEAVLVTPGGTSGGRGPPAIGSPCSIDKLNHSMNCSLTTSIPLLLLAAALSTSLFADSTEPRARPPEWTQDVRDVFFEDARQQLVGKRPSSFASSPEAISADTDPAGSQSTDGNLPWSKLIDGATLTTEVKRLNQALASHLKNKAAFKGGGNLHCRRDFSLLATLFGVISQFDEDVRWQRAAQLMRAKCLHAAVNCKAASDQSYAGAEQVRILLEDLIRGQTPRGRGTPEQVAITDRAPLMQRMEVSLEERISQALASERDFRRGNAVVLHESQILAMLSQAIHQEPYEYYDDDTFLEYAAQLRSAARDLVRATGEKNYQRARSAAAAATQSCSTCHEGYR